MIDTTVKAGPPDYALLITLAILLLVGLVSLYSASLVIGYNSFEQPAYFFLRQAAFAVLGLVVMTTLTRIDYHRWQQFSLPLLAGTVFALLLVLLFGEEVNGARRWLISTSIQPSEVVKLVLIIYMADWLSRKGEEVKSLFYGLIPFAMLVGAIISLILRQPDFGTAILILIVTATIFFVAGADIRQLAISGVAGMAVIWGLAIQAPYRLNRIAWFWDPFTGPYDPTYQVRQVLIALGSGGLWGAGLGVGRQKFLWLPLAHTDTIFAAIGEEVGLIGCLAIVVLFLLFAYRGLRIAYQAADTFGALLATGVTCWLTVQAAIHMAATTALIPFTGVPLPLISYGGSSLVISLAGVGLLLNVSRYTRRVGRGAVASVDFGGWHSRPRLSGARGR